MSTALTAKIMPATSQLSVFVSAGGPGLFCVVGCDVCTSLFHEMSSVFCHVDNEGLIRFCLELFDYKIRTCNALPIELQKHKIINVFVCLKWCKRGAISNCLKVHLSLHRWSSELT